MSTSFRTAYFAFMRTLVLFIAFVFSGSALAGTSPVGLTYQGRIVKPDGTALESASVQFTLQIRSPGVESCVLFEEAHTLNMAGSEGVFSLVVGAGTPTVGSTPYSVTQVFSNAGAFTGLTCAVGTTYTASAAAVRKLKVSFDDGAGLVTINPDHDIQSVPYALHASQLEGLGKDAFIKVNTASSDLTQAKADQIFLPANFTELMNLITGASTQYAKSGDLPVAGGVLNLAGGGVLVPDVPASGDAAVNKDYVDVYLGGKTLDSTGVGPAVGNGKILVWDQGANKWVVGDAVDATKLPLAGGTMTGAITMGGNNVLAAGHVQLSPQRTLLLGSYTNAQETTLAAGLVAGDKGRFWFNTDVNELRYWNGTAVQAVGLGSGTVTNVSGTAPISVATGTTTPVISIADATTAAKGAVQVGSGLAVASGVVSADVGTTAGKLMGADAVVSCLSTQKLQMSAGPTFGWSCVADQGLTSETDPSVAAFAKSAPPTCGAGQVLKSDGTNLSCVTDDTNDATKLPLAGGTMTGPLVNNSNSASTAVAVTQSGAGYAATFMGGNVGIGTTSPGARLEVQGPLSSLPATSGGTQTGSASRFSVSGVNTVMDLGIYFDRAWIQVNRGDDLSINRSLLLNPNGGNVGIGTTSPVAPLDVTGGITVQRKLNDNWGTGIEFRKDRAGAVVQNGDYLGSIEVKGYDGSTHRLGASIDALVDGVPGASDMPTRLIFSTTPDGSATSTERMRITNAGAVGIGGATNPNASAVLDIESLTKGVLIPRMTTAQRDAIATPATGLQVYNTTTNALNFYNGSAWQALGVAGSGLTSLGGQTGSTQTFASGSAGTAPAINSVGNVHTLDIPLASGAGVTSGTISKTDYDAFVAKLTSPLTTKGDLLSRDGSTHVRLPAGTNGQVLSADSAETSGLKWVTPASGTVTNVTGTAPIAVATGTTTPVISIADATTSAKGAVQVGSGLAVAAGVVSADIGTTAGKVMGADAVLNCLATQKLQMSAGPTFAWSCVTDDTNDATKLPLAGGTMTGPLVNNSNSASTAVAVTQSGAGYAATFMGGNVGIGTTTPALKAHVVGSDGQPAGSGTAQTGGLRVGGASVSRVMDFGVDSGTSSAWLQVTDSGDLSNVGYFFLNPRGGSVAIGTSLYPVSKLDVRGPLVGVPSAPFNQLSYDTASWAQDVGGGIGFGGNIAAGTPNLFAGVRGGKENATVSNNAGYLALHTRAHGGNVSEKMRIDSSGNVGIGTPTPGAALDITTPADTIALQSTGYSVTGANGTALLNLTGTWNTTGNPVLIKADITNTASGASSMLMDLRLSGSPKFQVDRSGAVVAWGLFPVGNNSTLNVNWASYSSANVTATRMNSGTFTQTSGSNVQVAISPTYNQTSGTAANTDLLIDRTQTAVGSGAQWLIDARVNSSSMFNISNVGDAYFAGNVGIGAASPNASAVLDITSLTKGVLIPRMTTAQRDAIATPAAGLQVYNTTTNALNFYNGSAWQALGVAGSGLTSLGGQTGSTQTFASGSAGTAPAISSAADVHTLNIPLASGAGVTSGTISKTDYDAFVAKLTSPLTTKGDLLSRDGSTHVRLPAGTNGQVLSADSAETSGLKWVTPASGTVTNVTGTAPIAVATGTTVPVISIADATTSAKGAVQVGSGLAVAAGVVSADIGTTAGKVMGADAVLNCLSTQKLQMSAGPTFAWSCVTDDTSDATKLPLAGGTMTGPLVNNSNSASTAVAVTQSGAGYAATFMGGNVGIGTTSPQASLEVRSTAIFGEDQSGVFNPNAPLIVTKSSKPHLLLEDAGSVVGGLAVSPAGTTLGTELGFIEFRTGVTYTGDFTTTGTQRMVIDSTGNVGIGTTSPSADLAFGGNASRTLSMERHTTANTAGNDLVISAGGATSGATDKKGGDLYLKSGVSTGSGAANIILQVSSGTTTGTADRPFYGMGIYGASGGKVVIGGTNPTGKFEVYQDSASTSRFMDTTNDHNYYDGLILNRRISGSSGPNAGFGTGIGFQLEGFSESVYPFVGRLGVSWENNQTNDIADRDSRMTFETMLDGVLGERMRVTGAGNVGIGTPTPGAKLEVAGQVKITGGTPGAGKVLTSDAAGLATWEAPSGGALSAITAATAINTIDNLNFAQTWNWSTATTQSPLTINANALTTGSILSLSTSNATVNSTDGLLRVANTGVSTTGTLARFQSNSTAGSGLTVLNSGNVGVGTASPGYKLEVNGAIKAALSTGESQADFNGSGVAGGFNRILDGVTNSAGFGMYEGAHIDSPVIWMWGGSPDGRNMFDVRKTDASNNVHSGTSLFTVRESGNVGIGTTSPGALLQIGTAGTSLGTMRMTGNTSGYVQIQPAAAAGSWTMTLPSSAGASGQVLTTNGAGVLSWAAAGTGNVSQGGNSFGAAMTIGTNDAQNLNFEVNNATVMTLTGTEAAMIGGTTGGYKSFAVGDTAVANGIHSVAFGHETTAGAFKQVVIGTNNKPVGTEDASNWVATDPLFVIGNGTAWNATSNAVMFFKDGRSLFRGGTTVAIPSGNASVTAMGTTTDNTAASFNATNSSGTSVFYTRNDGNVGIGTTGPLDKLHVAGDARVGTGTTGCVKDADGTVLAGTCSSDARFKKDIEPLSSKLEQVSQLRPVTYKWRSEEFPDKHFGHETETGLIAQEVRQALPELVTEDDEGYLRVRFTELNIYLLQAVKELYGSFKQALSEIAILKKNDSAKDRAIASVQAENAALQAELLSLKTEKDREIQALKAYLCGKDPAAPICK